MSTTTYTCQWFALCVEDAVGIVRHPVLGAVECCQGCADRLGLTLEVDPENPQAAVLPDPEDGWFNDRDNLCLLAEWLSNEHSLQPAVDNILCMLEKPWKYEDDFKLAVYKATS